MSAPPRSWPWHGSAVCAGFATALGAVAWGDPGKIAVAGVGLAAGALVELFGWIWRQRQAALLQLRVALQAKENAEALLEMAGRIARLGHWEQARDGSGPKWSNMAYEIHELEPGVEVTRDQSMEFIHPDYREAMFARVREAIRTGEIFHLETRLITARGRELWAMIRGEPMADEAGHVHSMRGVIQDIDARRRASELLEEKNRELQLATARAEAHARAKSEFLANMSHEIRTPLNAIIGISDLLTDAKLPVRERELIQTIHTSGEVLLALINDILDFSKIESGQLGLERIPVSLRDCVESALDLVAASAAKKQLDLVHWIDPELPAQVWGDSTRVRQVLVNLLSNAIKFTLEGHVEVLAEQACSQEGGRLLRISVRDTGIGIPQERMGRLFQAFSQVDSSTTRKYGGTGLGLAISQRLVEKMAGRLWVESTPGQGSCFCFELPLAEVAGPGEFDDSMKGRRVLIAGGDGASQRGLMRQMKSWGMEVTAGPADEALRGIIADKAPDLVVIDAGPAETREAAASAEERGLPVLKIAVMGERNEDGHDSALIKPLKMASFFQALKHAVRKNPEPASQQAPVPPLKLVAEECPLRILVAEDNPINQRVTALLLQRFGYRCHVVANGLEVLEAVKRTTFDVILMDVQMPEMDGLEAARSLCLLHPPAERPSMVALTAHATQQDRAECLQAGMDDYLTKPIQAANLAEALRRAYQRRQAIAVTAENICYGEGSNWKE